MRCDEGKDDISLDEIATLSLPAAVTEDDIVVLAKQVNKLLTTNGNKINL